MYFKGVIYFALILILIHFVCYFFNFDLFECFEKKVYTTQSETFVDTTIRDDMEDSIDTLTKSLEQLKEITNT